MRLDKFLAEASAGSKKIVRNYVIEGKVTVNSEVVLDPSFDINENIDVIRCLGKEIIHTGKKYYMFHKPAGCITARQDINCPTVLDYFDKDTGNGLFPVGRLDKDTEGLLLLTNDGDFNHRLMHPDQQVEKIYFFWAFGSLDSLDRRRLTTGIVMGEDKELVKALKIEIEEEGNYEGLKDKMPLENRKSIKMNPNKQSVVSGYLTIAEGRKHQVKRMLKAVGCYVVYLKRVSIGDLKLDEMLEKGQYRALAEEEMKKLFKTLDTLEDSFK